MRNDELEPEGPAIDENSPEWAELNRQAQAAEAEFERIVLENPLEALKPASLREVMEGVKIVDRKHQKDGMRLEERQRTNQVLVQSIITYKTGKQVPEEQEAWALSTGLFLRETLFREGLTPKAFLPTKRENLRARLGDFASDIKYTLDPRPVAAAFKSGLSQNQPSEPGRK